MVDPVLHPVKPAQRSAGFSRCCIGHCDGGKALVLSDFEIMHTVEQLARKTGISEACLQAAFKHLYGTTVAQFSRQARLEEGHRILSTTTYLLRVVCLMVGYPDAPNFSVAFKNQYGYWPSRIQQKKCSLWQL